MLRDRIVCGVFSKVKERLLRDNELTFQKAICVCRANEESQSRLKDLQYDEEVHAVRVEKQNAKSSPGSKNTLRPKHHTEKPSTPKPQPESKSTTFACRKCGNKHGRRNCPAYEKFNRCHKIGHFASQCRTKSVFACSEEYEERSEHFETHEKFFIGSVNSGNRKDDIYKVLEINNKQTKFKLDTGPGFIKILRMYLSTTEFLNQ
jgi:hypothetical protein